MQKKTGANRPLSELLSRRIQHILNENAVSFCGIADHDMSDGTDKLAVLDDGAAAHECGQVGTTLFINSFVSLGIAS